MVVILSNGKIYSDRDSIIAMHKEWFASKTWAMNCDIKKVSVRKNFGIALLSFNYHDVDEQGNPIDFKNLLTLIFENQDGEWRLIHDQNTRKK